jgi:hypothetical protein
MNPCQQDDDAYNHWLAAEIQAAIDDPRPSIPHEEVMAEMEAEIARLKEGNPTKHTAQQAP